MASQPGQFDRSRESNGGAVLAFPLHRRRDYVRKQAFWFVEQGQRAAESNLHSQLMLQRDVLLRRGIDGEEIERQIKRLECAIRSEVQRLLLTPEGAV